MLGVFHVWLTCCSVRIEATRSLHTAGIPRPRTVDTRLRPLAPSPRPPWPSAQRSGETKVDRSPPLSTVPGPQSQEPHTDPCPSLILLQPFPTSTRHAPRFLIFVPAAPSGCKALPKRPSSLHSGHLLCEAHPDCSTGNSNSAPLPPFPSGTFRHMVRCLYPVQCFPSVPRLPERDLHENKGVRRAHGCISSTQNTA